MERFIISEYSEIVTLSAHYERITELNVRCMSLTLDNEIVH